jgi:hypothetical protein
MVDELVARGRVFLFTKAPDIALALQVGDTTLDRYYEPGERIIDSIVMRGILQVPEGTPVQPTVDDLIHRMQQVGDHLAHFSGYMIMEYSR